ncbi:tyrosine-type recombinase/integrase [Salmonella enterica]|nr:tyrosine-type recombinase/integrase [Salmonella enterica]
MQKPRPLSNIEIKNARPSAKPRVLYDGDGLELKITPQGSKLWLFRYYHPHSHKRRTMSIGPYPAVSLAYAREIRDKARELLAREIDPQEHKEAERLEQQRLKENTFKKIAGDWYKVKCSRNLTPHTLQDIWNSLNRYVFPHIGDLPIHEITASQFIAALEPTRAAGKLETVKRMTQRINEVMDFALNTGVVMHNPAARISKAFERPVVKHQPTIPPEGLPELMRALSVARISRQTRCVVEWQLLTMCRPAEAASARWSEINTESREWHIPAGRMKMRREHVIPLSKQALAVLDVMRPISQHREYVFPGLRDPRQPMNSQSANMALKRMGYKDILVAHGLRALASTTLNEAGFFPDVIEAALAHIDINETRRAYNRSTYLEQRRKMMDWWGEHIEKAATGRFSLAHILLERKQA